MEFYCMGNLLWSSSRTGEICLGAIVDRWPSVLQHIYALVLVLVGWVFFFSPSLGAALRYLLQWLVAEQDLPVKKYSL